MTVETQRAIGPATGIRSGEEMLERPQESLWRDSFRRLLRNKAAVAAGIYIIALMLGAIFTDVIMPYERDKTHFGNTREAPERRFLVWHR